MVKVFLENHFMQFCIYRKIVIKSFFLAIIYQMLFKLIEIIRNN